MTAARLREIRGATAHGSGGPWALVVECLDEIDRLRAEKSGGYVEALERLRDACERLVFDGNLHPYPPGPGVWADIAEALFQCGGTVNGRTGVQDTQPPDTQPAPPPNVE